MGIFGGNKQRDALGIDLHREMKEYFANIDSFIARNMNIKTKITDLGTKDENEIFQAISKERDQILDIVLHLTAFENVALRINVKSAYGMNLYLTARDQIAKKREAFNLVIEEILDGFEACGINYYDELIHRLMIHSPENYTEAQSRFMLKWSHKMGYI